MVHRDDAAGAVRYLLEADCARGDAVLVVDDEPIDKHAFRGLAGRRVRAAAGEAVESGSDRER